jgi:diaminopimelate epimerase
MTDFRKYHGLGNDYLVIDPAEFPLDPVPAAVQAICDRNWGVGSDGILLGPLPDAEGPTLRIYNPDGSEAEKSGNGLRIFAWFLFEQGYRGKEFPLRTAGGDVRAWILDKGLVRMDMGRPHFEAPLGGELLEREHTIGGEAARISFVSMGNPHCVVTGLPVTEARARRLGPLVEHDPLFPARTNVQFLEVLNQGEIRIEIWERGAGYTLASGSSSCAAAAAARRLGRVGDDVTVHMPGGRLQIHFEGGHAFLTGPVEKVFEGTFSEELKARIAAGGGLSSKR